MAAGWVYVLTNRAFPHLVKVGKTTTSPEQRAAELAATGVPDTFEVAFAALSPDVDRHEVEAHTQLSKHRYRGDREFFEIDVESAIATVRRVCGAGDVDTIVALKIELDMADGECRRLRAQAELAEVHAANVKLLTQKNLELSERLAIEESLSKHQRNLADTRRQMLVESQAREATLTASIEDLNRQITTLQAFLPNAILPPKEVTR